jgi:glycosyltransferase involved in cell wall biosynthesis
MTCIGIIATPTDIHAVKWASALAEAGCRVFFFCPAPELRPIPNVEMVPIEGRHPKAWSYFDFLWSARRLRKSLLKHPCRIYISLHVTPFGVWTNWSGIRNHMIMALGADILEYTLQVPEQFRWSAESTSSPLYKRVSRLWHRFQVKLALQKADFIWADNHTLQSAIQRWLPEVKCRVFTWGIDTGFYTPSESPQAKTELRSRLGIPQDAVVVFSGRGFKAVYHPQTILKAAELLKEENIYWVLLKGNYPVPETILQMANQMDTTKVRFIFELLSVEQLRDYYRASDLMISLPEYDGMSASVLEALATGLYPILSDVPGNREIQEEGLTLSLCDPHHPEDLSQKILDWKAQYDQSSYLYVHENRNRVCKHADLSSQTLAFLQWLEHAEVV